MKKIKTEYIFHISNKKDWIDDIEVEVNEEYPDHMRIKTYQERRRTKEEFIKLYEGMIKELKDFKNNKS